ncbi:hypothetical protein CLV96_2128 [Leptospira meyeri]|uniref:Uncharacterized protein n=1 Tax=Leptospira meyeri TaxID=29508 RepID=A0A4R8MZ13_LEPME|nr:hypothetical protein [Leptospira meyeri]EKJ87886.1 hypothetical protein LEP1GSC017_1875 [Leptospira meyeri serovar Hardjo str. Went 5]TDY73107.1 hypothetical protein CLV96_2128 [Leptospira meyeri]
MQQYTFNKYFAKKSFLKIFGGEIRIFDENKNNLLFFVKQKAFKLKEDITVYADETKSKELLKIKARSVIDFSATYDVVDLTSNEAIGSLRRKGFKSILKDSWEILDIKDQVVGSIDEDSMLKAILRRFLTNLIPQSFFITINKNQVGILKQTFNPFVPQFNIDFSSDVASALDRRMGIAIVILLQIIEGRQQ